MEAAVDAVRTGFREWGENSQLNAPRRRIHIPTGVRVSVHQGGVPAAHATGLMTHCEWVKPMAEEQIYPRLNHPVIVLYDADAPALAATLEGNTAYRICGTIEQAAAAAARDARAENRSNAVVLLSPACASYDQYRNFEIRGDAFRALVAALPGIELRRDSGQDGGKGA